MPASFDQSEPTRSVAGERARSLHPADELHEDLTLAFGDRYVIGDKLGEGGFGSVYRGFDHRLKRPVAVKAARTGEGPLGDAMRFTQEARRVAQLRHPGIVGVQDVASGGRHCFIVSELLVGSNLTAWLRQEQLSWSESLSVAAAVADALAHAHARGIIHRDVKPDNIILLEGHRPVLVDFGIALSEQTLPNDALLSAGTPAYMPPEQVRGLGSRPDSRTDVYSLGATLYEMLAGRPPFQAADAKTLLRLVRDQEPPTLRSIRADIPSDVETVCRKAMAKSPGDRYATALEFAEMLRGVLHRTRTTYHTSILHKHQPPGPVAPVNSLGNKVSEGSVPSSARRMESERRQVSVLQAAFELTTNLDLEAAHECFLAFQSECKAIVAGCGGYLMGTSGNAVHAVFGYPIAREDAARQVVRAALTIANRSMAGHVRVAVHTGVAIVDETAQGVPRVGGEVISALVKVDALLTATGVLITDATRRLVEGFFECAFAGEVRLRADGSLLTVHRVKAERAARNRIDATDPLRLTPLVGRDRELGLLRERWELASEGHGHVVVLVGDPGVGKSRLVREVRELVSDPGAVITWHASALHTGSPFHPVIEFFRQRLDVDRESDPDRRLDRLIRHLREDRLDDPERVALLASLLSLPAAGRLPVLNLSADRIQERIHETLVEWVRNRVSRRPVLLIVEDLHWLDPSSLDLLGRVVEQCRDCRLLAVFTARPEFAPSWDSPADVTQFVLPRMTRRQVAEMIQLQPGAGNWDSATVEHILQRTDGVPLFIEEYSRSVSEQGAAASIPDTLQDLLLARLDHYAGDRELIQLASAIDRTFPFELLEAASGLSEVALIAELRRFVAGGLLLPKGSPPRCPHAFKHALLQDAAYQSMVKSRRQQVHRRIAAALEGHFPDIADTQPERLAHHFTEAGEPNRALEWWLKAGHRARERSAYREAVRHLSRGLTHLEARPETVERDARELDFRLPLAACFIVMHGYASPEVAKQVERLEAIRSGLDRADHYFPIRMLEWSVASHTGRIEKAQRIAKGFVGLAEMDCSDGLRTEAHFAAGCTEWWAGDFPTAWNHLERADLLYRVDASIEHTRVTQQNVGPLAMAYSGLTLWMLGYPERATEKLEAALGLAEDLKHPFTLAATLWAQAFHAQLEGDSEKVLTIIGRVITLSEEQSFAFWKALGLGIKGAALATLGQDADAIPLLRDSLARVEATGCEKFHQFTLHALAGAQWRLGERDSAWESLTRAILINECDRERFFEAELYRLKAHFHLHSEPRNEYEAVVAFQRAGEVAARQGARWFLIRTALDWAALHIHTRPSEARRLIEESLEGLTEGLDSREVVAAREFLNRL